MGNAKQVMARLNQINKKITRFEVATRSPNLNTEESRA